MKYYPREPDKALVGMAELTLEQRGAYNTLIDMLYARDGIVPDDDAMLARCMRVNVQRWRRLKAELMARGKIRTTIDGLLTANGVELTMKLTSSRSLSARKSATLRWENYRKAREINNATMRSRNANNKNKNNSVLPSKGEDSGTDAVDEGDNFGAVPSGSTWGSGELERIVQAKGWKP